ncbi:hypothetical protein KKA47_06910 [bacterium]|nr:hypothetical protein [bacterium]
MKNLKIWILIILVLLLYACGIKNSNLPVVQEAAPQTPAQQPTIVNFIGKNVAGKNVVPMGEEAGFEVLSELGELIDPANVAVSFWYENEEVIGDVCGSFTNKDDLKIYEAPTGWPNKESKCTAKFTNAETQEEIADVDVYIPTSEDFVRNLLEFEIEKIRDDVYSGDLSEDNGILHSCFKKWEYYQYEDCSGDRDAGEITCEMKESSRTTGLYYSKFADSWSDDELLSENGTACAISSENNKVVIVWKESLPKVNDRGFDYEYRVVFSEDGGVSFMVPIPIKNVFSNSVPQIALNSDGLAYIIYTDTEEDMLFSWCDSAGCGDAKVVDEKVGDETTGVVKMIYDDINDKIFLAWIKSLELGENYFQTDIYMSEILLDSSIEIGQKKVYYGIKEYGKYLPTLSINVDKFGNPFITFSEWTSIEESETFETELYSILIDYLTKEVIATSHINYDVSGKSLPAVGSGFADYANAFHYLFVSFGEDPHLGESTMHYAMGELGASTVEFTNSSIVVQENLSFYDQSIDFVMDSAGRPYAMWDVVYWENGKIDRSEMWMLRPKEGYDLNVENSLKIPSKK